ncbi:DinB family protein [Paenibacillus sp. GSMTC-2017]|uniref:DinB family protein n=1 Tax=Paenibacillus sp. GSMTC-2017 TaxID=2794350 RepID=UPI0018D9DB03|nr:DinB family protein [Paenibacillus sp. GSMTC-2017]MBH5319827.1 DinB family protein [Paenibacillus sp. GSMTC-2017]
MTQTMIQSAVTVRQLVIGSIQAIPDDWYDVQPEAFNHTIKWNVGHIITMMNWFLRNSVPIDYKTPNNYEALFVTGTKPSDWTTIPPTKDELIRNLSDQCEALANVTVESLEKTLAVPFELGPFRFYTAGELFNFAVAHEAVHLGMISGISKVVAASLSTAK